jgi:hypothetical protein
MCWMIHRFTSYVAYTIYLWDVQFGHPCLWIKHWLQQIIVTHGCIIFNHGWKMFIHIKHLFFVLFFNLIRGEWFLHCLLPILIFWSTIKIYLEFLTAYNFFSFICKNIHMFHHIFLLMPPTIQCIVEGTFMMIITWNFVNNLVILVLFTNWIKLPFISNWSLWKSKWEPTFGCGVSTMYPLLRNKRIEVRSHEIQVENNLWNLKIRYVIDG